MYQSIIRNNKRGRQQRKREFVEIGEGQQYGIVQDMLGNGRVNVLCDDGKVKVARIRGSMRKYSNKVIINRMDLVLVSLRDFGDDKVDLFHKYTSEDVSYLMRHRMLPQIIEKRLQNGGDLMHEDDKEREDYVVFMEERQSSSSDGASSESESGSDTSGGSGAMLSPSSGGNKKPDEDSDIDIDAI